MILFCVIHSVSVSVSVCNVNLAAYVVVCNMFCCFSVYIFRMVVVWLVCFVKDTRKENRRSVSKRHKDGRSGYDRIDG